MDNKLVKNALRGVSVLIGYVVARSFYKSGVSSINKRELLGDCEIISEEMEEEPRD